MQSKKKYLNNNRDEKILNTNDVDDLSKKKKICQKCNGQILDLSAKFCSYCGIECINILKNKYIYIFILIVSNSPFTNYN